MRAKGFLLGGTAGRTTLNGEGLQHEDGHSHLFATAIPTCMAYDPAFGYEIAVIVREGIRRMYSAQEDLFYYITLYNEPYPQPAMPQGIEQGIIRGMYKFRAAAKRHPLRAHLFGSGPILREVLRAQELLESRYGVAADVWSVTSYKELRRDCLAVERWNMLHPTETPKKPYVSMLFEHEVGPFIAASDYVKSVPAQIAPWLPGGLFALGTDGFGRSETRQALRRFFEVDAESITVATLHALAERGKVKPELVARAIRELGVDPEKPNPSSV
jgi:pyruvate dehydrogenase E1 component